MFTRKLSNSSCSLLQLSGIFLILLNLAACSGPRWVPLPKQSYSATPDSSELAESSSVLYERPPNEVAPGNLIEIRSPDSKLNGDYRVEFDGSLKLPYNVRVNSFGLTEDQLTDSIRSSYRTYLRSPNEIKVTVSKKEYLVDAQGLLNKPGKYVVKQNTSLDEIIAEAGGVQTGTNPENVPRFVRINGLGGTTVIALADYHSGNHKLQPNWQGGETLFFQTEGGAASASLQRESNSVRILGQVKNPAEYAAETNADFYTYLIKAGGPTDRADLGNIMVIRHQTGQTSALTFNLLDTSEIPEIVPGDTIILNADNATPLEKKGRIGASFANIITSLGIIAIALK